MSNPNGQPTDLRGQVRTKRRSNNRHTPFSAREPRTYDVQQPWIATMSTAHSAPQTRPAQPYNPEAVNHNHNLSGGAFPTSLPQEPVDQPANQPATPSTSTSTNILLPVFLFGHPHPTNHDNNNPTTPIAATATAPELTQQQDKPPQTPYLHPSSPTTSPFPSKLSDIDLRSPSDDPDYDFIESAEATHSARNAQPDRADKYAELEGKAKVGGKGSGGGGEEEWEVVDGEKAKKKGRGWFGFL